MAKCVHCGQKKGKRHCPALEDGICAQCCATHRLDTIQCPADCIHLQSEFYQQGRRSQKAQSAGKKFLERTNDSFHSEEAQGFAFMVQADLYWWCSKHAPLSNQEIARSLEAAARTAQADGEKNNLAGFLAEMLSRSGRYLALEEKGFEPEQRKKVLLALAASSQNHSAGEPGEEEEQSFLRELGSYFDELDFEADLDYSPLEELAEEGKANGAEAAEDDLVVPGQ